MPPSTLLAGIAIVSLSSTSPAFVNLCTLQRILYHDPHKPRTHDLKEAQKKHDTEHILYDDYGILSSRSFDAEIGWALRADKAFENTTMYNRPEILRLWDTKDWQIMPSSAEYQSSQSVPSTPIERGLRRWEKSTLVKKHFPEDSLRTTSLSIAAAFL